MMGLKHLRKLFSFDGEMSSFAARLHVMSEKMHLLLRRGEIDREQIEMAVVLGASHRKLETATCGFHGGSQKFWRSLRQVPVARRGEIVARIDGPDSEVDVLCFEVDPPRKRR